MVYKAVIFDLDGTLVHTMPEYRYEIVGQTLKDLGGKYSKHAIDRFWFEARRNEIIKEQFNLAPEVFWKTYRTHDVIEVRKKFTKVYDDAKFIKELRTKGYKIGIVTGAPKHIVSFEIEILGENDFDAIIRAQISSGITPKPHPHGLHECLRLLGVKEAEAIYVGNADEDVETARNAGVFDVLIVRGEHGFLDIEPSLKIESLYELRDFLENNKKEVE